MHEVNQQERMAKAQLKAPHYGAGAGILVLGLIAGRAFFPLEIPFVVEKEKRVEVPVERIVIQKEPFEVIKYVDRIVEKRVEVPVEKRVEVPVVKVVEKMVEVPVERIVYRDRVVEKPATSIPASLSSWRQISKGLSRDQVRSILGEPRKIVGGSLEIWYYGTMTHFGSSGSVTFYLGKVDSWSEP